MSAREEGLGRELFPVPPPFSAIQFFHKHLTPKELRLPGASASLFYETWHHNHLRAAALGSTLPRPAGPESLILYFKLAR